MYVPQNPASKTYLSLQIQTEFIQLLESTVREKHVYDIQSAKYYGIMLDKTPDAAHKKKKMSETIKYVYISFEVKNKL